MAPGTHRADRPDLNRRHNGSDQLSYGLTITTAGWVGRTTGLGPVTTRMRDGNEKAPCA